MADQSSPRENEIFEEWYTNSVIYDHKKAVWNVDTYNGENLEILVNEKKVQTEKWCKKCVLLKWNKKIV